MLNRRLFRPVCGRRETDVDRVFGDSHLARCGEQVCDELLRFARTPHGRRDESGELRLGVRADDANDIEDRLDLAGVPNELPCELGFLDGSVDRKQRPDGFEVTLSLDPTRPELIVALHPRLARSTMSWSISAIAMPLAAMARNHAATSRAVTAHAGGDRTRWPRPCAASGSSVVQLNSGGGFTGTLANRRSQ